MAHTFLVGVTGLAMFAGACLPASPEEIPHVSAHIAGAPTLSFVEIIDAVAPPPPQCEGARWSVKTGTDPDAQLVNLGSVTPTTIQTMSGFVPPPSLPENARVSPVETTVWAVDATLTLYMEEDDADYHVILKDQAGNTMITEIPSPSCVGAGSPFAEGIARVRSKFDAMFSVTTGFQVANIPVRVTGVGFFDFLHGQPGVAPNGIELHPVLDIVFNPSPSALALNLTLNTHSVAPGDPVQVSVTAANAGGAALVDLYFAILLPAASGPGLGCPNGDAVALFGNAFSTVVVTCVSAPPQTFPILFQHLSVPAGLPVTGVINFFSFMWPASVPPGTYTFAIFATPPDAFSDGTIDAGDVPTFAFDSLSFSP